MSIGGRGGPSPARTRAWYLPDISPIPLPCTPIPPLHLQVAPAADAIDPGLLAEIEQDLELDLVEEEMDLRQSDFEARRQQEIRIHKGWG